MKWAGHVARTMEEKYMHRKHEGEESLKTKCRWENNIKVDTDVVLFYVLCVLYRSVYFFFGSFHTVVLLS